MAGESLRFPRVARKGTIRRIGAPRSTVDSLENAAKFAHVISSFFFLDDFLTTLI
jgi:hypothetical protein